MSMLAALALACSAQAPDTSPPHDGWRQVVAGYEFLCALAWDGRVACSEEVNDYAWNYDGTPGLPDGRYISISAGDAHACGLTETGSVDCWGVDGSVKPYPAGPASSVNAMYGTCIVSLEGNVECDGGYFDPDSDTGFPVGVGGPITGKWSFGCVVTAGVPHCFHSAHLDPVDEDLEYWPAIGGPTDVLEMVPGAYDASVFVRTNGQFGMYKAGNVTYPPAPLGLTQLGFDGFGACGLQPDGHAWCYTPDPDERSEFGITPTPEGTFTSISVGWVTACALSTGGEISCWPTKEDSSGRDPLIPDPSTLTFADGSTEP